MAADIRCPENIDEKYRHRSGSKTRRSGSPETLNCYDNYYLKAAFAAVSVVPSLKKFRSTGDMKKCICQRVALIDCSTQVG